MYLIASWVSVWRGGIVILSMISSILKTSKLVEFITYVSYGIIGKNVQVLPSLFMPEMA